MVKKEKGKEKEGTFSMQRSYSIVSHSATLYLAVLYARQMPCCAALTCDGAVQRCETCSAKRKRCTKTPKKDKEGMGAGE